MFTGLYPKTAPDMVHKKYGCIVEQGTKNDCLCTCEGCCAAGLAAVLPCYWIYQHVGAYLKERGSPHPLSLIHI